MKSIKIIAIGIFMASLSPISAFAYTAQLVDVTYDPISGLNVLTAIGATQVNSGFGPAIASGHGTDSFDWSGSYTFPTIATNDWGHGCGYNGNFGSPNSPAWSIPSACIPAGGAHISGHDTIYECITTLRSGGPFYDVFAHGDVISCVEYEWNGTAYAAVSHPSSGITQIIDSVPPDQSVVATTTNSLGARVHINVSQWTQALAENNGNWFLKITLRAFATSEVGSTTCSQGNLGCLVGVPKISQPPITYVFPITTSGDITFSTTTDTHLPGSYSLNMQIVQNNTGFLATLLPWFGFGTTVLTAKAATFYVSNETITSTTTFGSITQPATTTDDIIAAAVALVNKHLLDRCTNWISFDMADCINALMIPRSNDYGPVMDIFADTDAGLFTYAPWGYVTRIVKIFNSTATSSFPVFAAYIPDPITHGPLWFHIDINEMFTGAAATMDSIRDPVTGDNPRDGLEQIVRSILALSVISFILYDLVGGKKSGQTHTIKHRKKLS